MQISFTLLCPTGVIWTFVYGGANSGVGANGSFECAQVGPGIEPLQNNLAGPIGFGYACREKKTRNKCGAHSVEDLSGGVIPPPNLHFLFKNLLSFDDL